MKSFRTELQILPSKKPIQFDNPIVTIGSCFADTIGGNLKEHKFKTLINSFGTVYNPISIHKLLLFAIHNQPPLVHTYSNNSDLHFNFDFHSSFSSLSRNQTEKQITEAVGMAHYMLKSASHLMITFGTGWVYERLDTKEIVANCHKVPQDKFKKYLLSRKSILESFEDLYQQLKKLNPSLTIILTVSPVRHVKDTLELNSVSKAVLRLSCHTLTTSYPDVDYFPAYEILMDDLRDYRFYDTDLIHPSSLASDYIWQKFCGCYFDDKTKSVVQEWRSIKKSLEHKPFQPFSASHKTFLTETHLRLKKLSKQLDVHTELLELEKQITK